MTLHAGLDLDAVRSDVRPQDDLYRHVNGRWLETAEIPPDRAVDGAIVHLVEKAERDVRALVEAASASGAADGTDEQRVGDMYAAFMDEERVEELGAAPLAEDLAAVRDAADVASLAALIGRFQRGGALGAFVPFVDTDARQSDTYVLHVEQGGLGLPDESFYREDAHAALREDYVGHVARMLALAGVPDAEAAAARVLALETALASYHYDVVRNRDAEQTYHRFERDELLALTPVFPWTEWQAGHGAPDDAMTRVVVRQPEFLEGLDELLRTVDLQSWRDWLSWHLLRASAPFLSHAFVAENFAFYGTRLSGTPQLRERWKRGVALVNGTVGEAVGRLYVAEHFPPEARERMLHLVDMLVAAYREQIATLPWMGDETRQRALDKLARFTPKIGYPDEWRDYSALRIARDDLVGNVRRAAAFETDRNLRKIGGPVDRGEWFMTPQTVNAYYNPGMNEIVFPAAILQPPMFDMTADDAVNYGGIGAVIGHEIGHGFDDQGSKYDGDGNLVSWWTDEDRAEFELRTRALIGQYDVLEPAETPGRTVNGAFTVGENIGDLGGLSIAARAYRLSLDGAEPPVLDGLTGMQRLFFSWARVWRTAIRPAEAERRLAVDPHSPAEFRCNAVVRNVDDFHEAFGVTAGDALWLAPEDRVRIW